MTAERDGKWNESRRPESEVRKLRDWRTEAGGSNHKVVGRSNQKREVGQLNQKVRGWTVEPKEGWTVEPESRR
jgi:hypothetical protein